MQALAWVLLVEQKLTSQQEGLFTRIRLRALKISCSDYVGEVWVAWDIEKKHNFYSTEKLYICILENKSQEINARSALAA